MAITQNASPAVLLAALMFAPFCSAQLVEDDVVLLSTPGGLWGDVELGLSQTTSFDGGYASGLFGFGIDDLGDDRFQFAAFGIAERYALFLSMPGDLVDSNLASSATPFASNYIFSDPRNPTPEFEILALSVGESVFFGYWDDRFLDRVDETGSNIADVDDNYGWFELSRSDRLDSSFGQLEILGGATAVGRGIIVGTTTTFAIPEPSSSCVIGLLSAGVMIRRRKLGSDTFDSLNTRQSQ